MTNPLLNTNDLPPFNQIKAHDVEPAITSILKQNRETLQQILAQSHFTWDNLIAHLELMENKLNNVWSPISHLHAVNNSEELREAYHKALQQITEYEVEIGQNIALYKAIMTIRESEEFTPLNHSQKKIVENFINDFRLSGVHLPESDKTHFKMLDKRLTELMTEFEDNLLDATDNWFKQVTDESLLEGLPSHAIECAKHEAQKRQLEGYVFTLEIPSYLCVLTYAKSRKLREELYTAYTTRASDQGPQAHRFDNTPIIQETLKIRNEVSHLLGFKNFAEMSLFTKMANNPLQVITFLTEIAQKAYPKAKKELEELVSFIKTQGLLDAVQPWDIAYYSEKLKQQTYNFSEEELREYFPVNQVLTGLFELLYRLFRITIKEVNYFDKWHEDVQLFEVFDDSGVLRGKFYLDLYARPRKRGGAWVGDCRCRSKLNDSLYQIPVAYVICNFSAPNEHSPALLKHDEVITLFHEFGHAIHHVLTLVDYPSISGTNGIEWDAVEMPSQFMENWCWEKEVLDLISAHYKTGKQISNELYQHIIAAKDFHIGMATVRQLEFSLFDMRLHLEYDAKKKNQVQQILDEVRAKVSVIPTVKFNRFQNSFSHIFASEYAAGYYSYKWAEVLSSDAFAKFEENSLFDNQIGLLFLHTILETGGSQKALESFVQFRGREPNVNAFLRHLGLT